jgi:decaprenylphospho-beta-D-ribofuranose 2-oxidase
MRWNETDYSGWGRALVSHGRIARPEKLRDLMAVVSEAPAPAFGNRRSYGDAAQNRDGPAIDMTRLNRFLAFDPETGVLEAEAGVTISGILQNFAPKGWLPAVMPGTGFATLGGCIANDVHGKNHHIDGSFGAHADSIELLKPDGTKLRVGPSRNKALFNATIGGLGQTGVILSARIKLAPCGSTAMKVRERRIDALGEFIEAFTASDARYSVGWIDATATGRRLGRGILEEAGISGTGLPARARKPVSVPFNAPSFALSSPVVRLFNLAYLNRVPSSGREALRPIQAFFFPLDRIHHWNRLYGKTGFHQFQCVIPPDGAEPVLRQMLTLIAKSGRASPLAVLKRLGPQGDGLLSFPTEGFTLAVDIRNRGDVGALFQQLEQLCLSAGGRIYAAKDSLGSPEGFARSYARLPEFRKIADQADPGRVLETDLVRRLDIRGRT